MARLALAALYVLSALTAATTPPDGLYGHYVLKAQGVPAAAVTAGMSQYDFMGRMCDSLDAADVFLCHYWWRDGAAGKLHSSVSESAALEKAREVTDLRLELSKDMYMTESEGLFDWDAYSGGGPARGLKAAGSTDPAASVTVFLVDGPIAVTTEVLVSDVFESFSINGTKGSPCAVAHGTHVASVIAGATFGDSKVKIVSVAVMPGCGRPSRTSELVAGLDWILDRDRDGKGTVVAMSVLTQDSDVGDLVAEKVAALVASGSFVMTAAGDNADDACLYVPPKLPGVMTVASAAWTRGGTSKAEPAETTNYGPCVDLWAIGELVKAAGPTNGSTATYSGSAQAMAHVAKAVAESWNLTAAETHRTLVRSASDVVMQALTPQTTRLFLGPPVYGPPVYCPEACLKLAEA
jgi:Subtilase family